MAKQKLTEYQKKLLYNNTYNREHYRSFSIRYDIESEKQIIKWLEKQPTLKGYVTELILNDMKKAKKKKK
ncbi:MAG: hypothetical protein J6D29_00030 [Solobacterium sp.]|nr:hypothetical protein [Solobacterium sp.]